MTKIPDFELNNIGEGEIEITGELPVADFELYRKKALSNLGKDLKLDGFRPGHVPPEVLASKISEEQILGEMAELAISDIYLTIITEKKIMAIGRPNVTITKLAKDNPLGFKIKTALMPELEIGDYKGIAKKINSEPEEEIEIKDEEVATVLEDIRKSRAHAEHAHHQHKEGEECDCATSEPSAEAGQEIELNDEFAKSLGQFQTLEELKTKIKENLELEKKQKSKDKKRVAIISDIIKNSKLVIAPLLIEAEKDKMMAEMESQIGYMGLKFEDYLTHLKKTREELRTTWSEPARERVAFGLILSKIADLEKIAPTDEELKNELDYLKVQYKDIDEERLRSYATGLINNEKVFKLLEETK